jgi:two-component system, chemotaxis family, response regulator Rcp1
MTKLLKVLLVEDNDGDVEMTEQALRDSKPACAISVANNGVEALQFLSKQGIFSESPSPDLILLDLNMPRMDGKEFLDCIKSDPKMKSIPVVMFTSSQSETDVRDCYERYASCYVVKPFDGKEFAETLQEVVRFWGDIGRLPED